MQESREPGATTFVVAIDLEKVLFVPTLTHSQMYYSRQLSVYNLCIHAGDTQQAYMCMWHEGVAGRGANEVMLCLLKVLQSPVTAKQYVEIWCDNCAGQNKNQMLILAMFYLVATKRYKGITCRFLVSGHSYMPCDQDFAIIEKRKRLTAAMVPSDIKDVVRTAKLEHPFRVIDIEKGDIYDFKTLASQLFNTAKLHISSVSALKVTYPSLLQNSVLRKTAFGDLQEWTRVPVARKRINLYRDIPTELPRVSKPPTINANKINDLKNMIPFLDPKYRQFYTDLCR